MSITRFPKLRALNTVKRIPCTIFEEFEKNPETGVIRKRYFRFDLNALADFEQEVGMGFAKLMNMTATFAMVRALYFCGLKHEDRTLSIESTGDLLAAVLQSGEQNVDALLQIAFQAMTEQKALGAAPTPALPEGEAAEDEDEAARPNASAPIDGGGPAIETTAVPAGSNG